MKKFLIITVLLLSLMLSACGSKNVPDEPKEVSDSVAIEQTVTSEEYVQADQTAITLANPEEDAEAYLNQIEEIKNSEGIKDLRELSSTVKSDEDRAELKNALDETIANLGDAVEYYSYGGEGYSILIVFKGGYHYVISVGEPEEGRLGSDSANRENTFSSGVKAENDQELIKNKKMLIICQFDENEKYSYYVDGYKAVKEMYEKSPNGGQCDIIYNAKINDYKNLDDYGIVILGSHGALLNENGSPESIFSTGEIDSLDSTIKNIGDMITGKLCAVSTPGAVEAGDTNTYYAITERFLRKYYPPGSLDDTVVFAGCCYGYQNDSLADAFYDAGAGAYIGYSNATKAHYNNQVINDLFEYWLDGDSLEESLERIIAMYPNDVDAYNKAGVKANKDMKDASWLKYGGSNTGIKLTKTKTITVSGTIINNLSKYEGEYNKLWKEYRDKDSHFVIDGTGIIFDEPINGVTEAELTWLSELNINESDLIGNHLSLKGILEENRYDEEVTYEDYKGGYAYHPNGGSTFLIKEIIDN